MAEFFAEYGTTTLTHATSRVALSRAFDNPVVIAVANTANGADWFTVEVAEVGSSYIDLRLEEGPGGDGWHAAERVSWLVVEAGTWTMAGGIRIQAGATAARDLNLDPARNTPVSFDGFTGDPVVLHQVQGETDGYVRSRWRPDSDDPASGGDIYLDNHVYEPNDPLRAPVGYVAISDDSFGGTGDGSYLRSWHADQGTVGFTDVTDYTLENDFEIPAIFASIDSLVDVESVEAIITGVQQDSFQRRIGEDPAAGGDGVNGGDGVSLLALGTAGDMLVGDEVGGSDVMAKVGWYRIPSILSGTQDLFFDGNLTNSVFFAEPLVSKDSGQVRILRLDKDTPHSAHTLTMQNLPGTGPMNPFRDYTFNTMTVDIGTWQLSDGRKMQVGTTDVGGGSLSVGVDIEFDLDFAAPPALFLMVQTTHGADWVIARYRDVTVDGATLFLQEAEGSDGWHASEVVGWMAVETGVGSWDGFDFDVRTGVVVDQPDDGLDVEWTHGPAANAFTLAQLANFNGQDPVALVDEGTSGGFAYDLFEDRSGDSETDHLPESISFFGLQTPAMRDYDNRSLNSYYLTAEEVLI
ncbi:hypothetical protein ACQ5SO_02370 [Rhodovulum sp. DZ06]|uniref:hypothetical protein n=1 Tax=Rhodovulum sp. DZ06 TaxID=3425126 RepID=UPI003D354E96